MSDYFGEFRWALSNAFSDPLSKCRFEKGDILYDTTLAYSLPWEKAKQKIKHSIQVKYPSRTVTALTTDNTETVFKNNWDSEIIFGLFEYPSMDKKEITTTQGNLYLTLWKGDLSYIQNKESSNDVPLLSKEISQIPEIIQLHIPAFISDIYELIFFFPIDETSSLSKEKKSKIEKTFKSENINYKSTLLTPLELKLPIADFICPTIKIVLFEINGSKKMITASLKKALYVPSKSKKTKKEIFRLKTHGTFLKDYKIDPKHYFNISRKNESKYYDKFLTNFEHLRHKLTRKNLEEVLGNKLQLKNGVFNEKSFIQIACETTVNIFFSRNYPDSFEYEKKVNPTNDKNVECQFKDEGFIYNVEVKCADFEAKEKIDNQDALKFGTHGRLEDYKESMTEIGNLMVEGQKKKGEKPKPLIELRKMDNNLKEFLVLSNKKFNPLPDENEVNILVVCCGDAKDMQSWHNYMFAPTGLFTKGSFHNPKEYALVDVVVLTNLYHRHIKYFDKQHLLDDWDLDSFFNLVFLNPFRKLNKEKSIKHFLNTFPHYTYELEKYKLPLGNDPESMRQILESIVRIPAFVKHYFTDKGKDLF